MCGIFGFISDDIKNRVEFEAFANNLAVESQRRGSDATGFAAFANGEWIADKKDESADDFTINSIAWRKAIQSKSLSLIGHTRASTSGTPKNNDNNHPFVGPNYTIVHNGGVGMHRSAAAIAGFKLQTDCDSEVILHALQKHPLDKKAAVAYTIGELDPISAMAVAFLDHSDKSINLFRVNGSVCSIYFIEHFNCWAFASTKSIFVDAILPILGSTDNVRRSVNIAFEDDIPANTLVTLGLDRTLKVFDLSAEISLIDPTISKTLAKHREDVKNSLDYSTFSGVTRTGAKSWAEMVARSRMENSSDLDDTKISVCSRCFRESGHDTCDLSYCPMSSGSDKKSSASDAEITLETLLDVVPTFAASLVSYSDIPEVVMQRRPLLVEDYDLSEHDASEYMGIRAQDTQDKISRWSNMTNGQLESMSDGEYMAYLEFLQELVEAVSV